jgi:hypothetical protein
MRSLPGLPLTGHPCAHSIQHNEHVHELKQALAGCRLASSPYGQARGCCVSVSDSKGTPIPLSESDAH